MIGLISLSVILEAFSTKDEILFNILKFQEFLTFNSSSKDVTTSAKEEIPHLSPKPLTVTSTHVAPD